MDGTRGLRHIPALDGLRGLAVAGVITFHAGYLTGGYLGVDAFFVLSGFLITSLLLAESEATRSVSLANFWARRARRLLPALLTLLLAVSVYAAVWATPGERSRLRGDGLATLFYVANWHAVGAQQSYWAMFDTPSMLQHTWSLAIEEQFYLLWPLVALVALVWRRWSAKGMLAISLAGSVLSAVAMVALHEPGTDPSRVYFGTDTRIAAIFVGAALASAIRLWGPVRGPKARASLEAAGIAGIAYLAWAWFAVDGQSDFLYRGGLLLCGLAVVAVIAAATHPKRGPIGAALSLRPLCWIGIISYGLYLWHWPVFVVVSPERTGWQHGVPLLLVRLTTTVAVAAASYFLVEMPVRRGAFKGSPIARFAVPVTAAVTAAALLLATVSPADNRSDAALAAVFNPSTPTPTTEPAAGAGAGSTEPTGSAVGSLPTAPSRPRPADPIAEAAKVLGHKPRVLMVGDSVAFSLAAGLTPYQDQLGIAFDSKTVIACGVARGSGRVRLPDGTVAQEAATCNDWAHTWPDAINRFHPDLIIMVIGWPGSTERDFDGEWRSPCQPAFDDWYRTEYRDALDVLLASGARVATSTVPYWRGAKTPAGNDAKVDCVNRDYEQVLSGYPQVAVVDLLDHVCPQPPACRTDENGVELRDDGLHYNGTAGTIVGAWVVREALAGTIAA